MNVETFLAQHGLSENPFTAEEARHDPVFERLPSDAAAHPDFTKVLGRIDQPSTAIVFGEKGSGKTAIRLLVGRRVAEHNQTHPDRRILLVPYDDLNPLLDRVTAGDQAGAKRGNRGGDADVTTIERGLDRIRLEDHQDAVLSLAVTRLVDAMLGTPTAGAERGEAMILPEDIARRVARLPRQLRADVAVLAALYDSPRRGAATQRWGELCRLLKLGRFTPHYWMGVGTIVLAALAGGLLLADRAAEAPSVWMNLGAALAAAGAMACGVTWAWRRFAIWQLVRRLVAAAPALDRSPSYLCRMLLSLRTEDLAGQPWPWKGNKDARYQLTARLLGVLEAVGYNGMVVLVDRVDEPSLVSGQPGRMMKLVWPMLDNKFLQQRGMGIKLLLPLELRHALLRESPAFFQEARLDKQCMIDRLTWSGTTLYDLCSRRLNACRREAKGDGQPLSLTDLFEPEVNRQMLIDALEQMQQPRDAFKFLYAAIQEHCRVLPEEEASARISRPVMEAVRRQQSQRISDFHRGVSPA